MAFTKEKKKEIIEEIRDDLSQQKIIYFVNYKGLKAREIEILRQELKKHDANIMVVKKTLAKIAFEEEKIDFNPEEIDDELAFVFGYGDIVAPAKAINNFSKDYNLQIIGALLDESVLEAGKVKKLANLPSKEQLRGQLVATLASPLSNFVGVLEGNIKGLINVLKREAEKNPN